MADQNLINKEPNPELGNTGERETVTCVAVAASEAVMLLNCVLSFSSGFGGNAFNWAASEPWSVRPWCIAWFYFLLLQGRAFGFWSSLMRLVISVILWLLDAAGVVPKRLPLSPDNFAWLGQLLSLNPFSVILESRDQRTFGPIVRTGNKWN